MTAIAPLSPPRGFGDYILPQGKTFDQMQLVAKVQKIALAVIFSLLTIASIVLATISLPLGLLATGTCGYFTVQSILSAIGIFHRSRPMNDLFPKEVLSSLPPLGQVSPKPHSGFATSDGVESQEWKLNLIRAAKHHIFISGCYCGGQAFNNALHLIRERMRGTELKASILCSDWFITTENKKLIAELQNEFPNRFSCVITPEVFPFTSPTGQFALTTNHTKALVIDYGAAFMTGGSGMVNDWAKQTGKKEPVQFESHGMISDLLMKMRAFRDMDFVFQSPELNGIGTRFYVEMMKLFERFRGSKETPPLPPQRVEINLPMPRRVEQIKLAAYATGPDNRDTSFLKEIIAQIKNAKTSITIAHMYFHPTKEMLAALQEASQRGVKITLITNKRTVISPGTHLSFADLSRYYAKLIPNLELYEFKVPYTTYHKKVIVIDGAISLIGSTNIGMKSLQAVDYEFNLKVESEPFAVSIATLLEADKELCKKNQYRNISVKTRLFSNIQSLCTPFL